MGRKLHLRAMVCSRNEGGSKRKVGGGATGRAKSKRTKRATEKARAATSTGDDVQAGRDDADFDTAAAFGPEAQHDDVPEGRRGRRRVREPETHFYNFNFDKVSFNLLNRRGGLGRGRPVTFRAAQSCSSRRGPEKSGIRASLPGCYNAYTKSGNSVPD